jgi:hypothetical protein
MSCADSDLTSVEVTCSAGAANIEDGVTVDLSGVVISADAQLGNLVPVGTG